MVAIDYPPRRQEDAGKFGLAGRSFPVLPSGGRIPGFKSLVDQAGAKNGPLVVLPLITC